jgi:pantoate--beta-alanine ligase
MVKSGEHRAAPLLERVHSEIAAEPLARLEYASIVDPETLVEIEELGERAVLALAVRIGKARLIDNVMLERRR